MKKKNSLIRLGFSLNLFFYLSCAGLYAQSLTASDLLDKIYSAVNKCSTLSYNMATTERMKEGGYHYGASMNKLNVQPLKLYMKITAKENNGVELMYNEGLYGKEVIVNAAKWLPNLKFNPFAMSMRKNQHHTIYESGYKYGIGILYQAKNLAGKAFNDYTTVEDNINCNGKICYRLTANDVNFKFVSYKVQPGETLYKLAISKAVSEYLIVERNNSLKDYTCDITGKTLLIPSGYALKSVIYVDKTSYLPIVLEMYDERGLFEKYEFKDVKVNPSFKADEFTKDYDEYGF